MRQKGDAKKIRIYKNNAFHHKRSNKFPFFFVIFHTFFCLYQTKKILSCVILFWYWTVNNQCLNTSYGKLKVCFLGFSCMNWLEKIKKNLSAHRNLTSSQWGGEKHRWDLNPQSDIWWQKKVTFLKSTSMLAPQIKLFWMLVFVGRYPSA